MKKFFLVLLASFLFSAVVIAEETDAPEENDNFFKFGEFRIKKTAVSPEINSLDFDREIKPLNKELSAEEKINAENSDFDRIEEPEKRPEISCDLPQLKTQVASFIYKNLNNTSSQSAIAKRQHILTIKNLHDFVDVTAEKIDPQEDFSAAAAIAYLKINENRKIVRVCRSSGNDNAGKLGKIYAIIYPYASYYKVVVSNLITSIDKINDATFIYNW